MKIFLKIFNWFVFCAVCLIALAALLHYSEVVSPFDSAFVIYNANPGILAIVTISFISAISFIVSFLLSIKLQDKKLLKVILIGSALVIAFLQWFELWYGSTFSYGEVRDKQGLFFPFTSAFLLTYILLNLHFSKDERKDLRIKISLVILTNLFLFLFFKAVYEPWRLWQS